MTICEHFCHANRSAMPGHPFPFRVFFSTACPAACVTIGRCWLAEPSAPVLPKYPMHTVLSAKWSSLPAEHTETENQLFEAWEFEIEKG